MQEFVFHPPRRRGLLINGVVILLLSAGGALGLLRASLAETNISFWIFLLAPILAVVIVPIMLYRSLALQRASYILLKEGIRLRWGLRGEDIPMTEVAWVGLASQHQPPLQPPRLYWPGALLRLQTLAGGSQVEYLAAQADQLVIIRTARLSFAISPADPAEFLRLFQSLAELGSFSPINAHSVYPAFLLSRSWQDQPARLLILVNLLLFLGLLTWVVLGIRSHPQVSLRLAADGSPLELVPGVRLMLLPVLDMLVLIANLLLGLFFYRRPETLPLSYLMWVGSAFISLLLLGAVMFVLQAV